MKRKEGREQEEREGEQQANKRPEYIYIDLKLGGLKLNNTQLITFI